jgi:two-component system chemotaxis sensor kinase CheA
MADEIDPLIDKEFIVEFITESEEILENLDKLCMGIDQDGVNKESLDALFRGVHSLKGTASFLGVKQIIDISHKSESILREIRDADKPLTDEIMDVLLKSFDSLRFIIFHLKLNDGIDEDCSEVISELDNLIVSLGAEDQRKKSDSSKKIIKQDDQDTVVKSQVKSSPAKREREIETTKKQDINPKSNEVKVHPKYPQKIGHKYPEMIGHKQKTLHDDNVSTLRVDVVRIDKVMDYTGEIVLVRNRLINLTTQLDNRYCSDPQIEELMEATAFLDRISSDLQLAVMKMRMQPINKVLSKFPRLVRDTARDLGKDIQLNITGEHTEVDKSVIENIGDPLVHILRNSIDHGIEMPLKRQECGKPVQGVIAIHVYQRNTQIVIEINDDGKGIDVDAVKRKAVEKGIISEERSLEMDDSAAINMIFLPSFSTKETPDSISGRGVGMDVVNTNVSKLNGFIEVFTRRGIGSTFRISLPLTLVTIKVLKVRYGKEIYAIPQSIIEETLRISKEEIQVLSGQKVLTLRGRVLPIVDISEMVTLIKFQSVAERDLSSHTYVLLVAIGDKRFCVSVDELIGQEEVVIKSVNGLDSERCGIIGTTISGDGNIVFILDLMILTRGVFI